MNIGIYGGSFNPAHFGHLKVAEYALAHTDWDELWLMVSPNNPLKDARTLAPENERLNALKIFLQENPPQTNKKIVVSDFEFTLPKPSYTADTLRALRTKFSENQFALLIGEDNLQVFQQWKDWQYILSHFPIFIYPRNNGKNIVNTITSLYNLVPTSSITFFHDAPLLNISSTQLRAQQDCVQI